MHAANGVMDVFSRSEAWTVIGVLAVLTGVAALLAEWQRRTTLVALVRNAPPGTVVVQERGRGGPAMQVHVGAPSTTDQGEAGVTDQEQNRAAQVSALWKREAVHLLRYAMVRTGGNKSEAEDLVQQTFMAAFEQWKDLACRNESGQRGWLRRVCKNKWIDQIRREVLGEHTLPELDRYYGRSEPDPEAVIIAREDLDDCWQVIRQLSPRRRQVALLHFVDQLPAMAIAELLHISPEGVRKHIAKARKALREALPGLFDADTVQTGTVQDGEGE
ncbi:RNA polymerase sigma factor [Streptomyces sp. NPDC102364]|uniref:RNA polymerase sigma factor n=1 Tax=Streptomyces sp. NPDC102364 TaxID=3366161 RepID=UPI0037F507C7